MFEYLGLVKFVDYELSGVVSKKECRIPVKVCRVVLRLEDPYGNILPEFEVWSAISEMENTPFLLGMKDIVKTFKVELDPEREELRLVFIDNIKQGKVFR